MKRGNHSRSRFPKALALVLAMVLLVGAAIGGTVAWLTDQTQEVENTFTVGNIDIELAETGVDAENKQSFKMIPGYTHTKDPKVTVLKNSEPCWVFVEVTTAGKAVVGGEEKGISDYLDYSINTTNWTVLDAERHPGVYYKKVDTVDGKPLTANLELPVLTNNQVKVKDSVTKAMMDAMEADGATLPKLTFTAYAIQQYAFNDADAAWHELKNLSAH